MEFQRTFLDGDHTHIGRDWKLARDIYLSRDISLVQKRPTQTADAAPSDADSRADGVLLARVLGRRVDEGRAAQLRDPVQTLKPASNTHGTREQVSRIETRNSRSRVSTVLDPIWTFDRSYVLARVTWLSSTLSIVQSLETRLRHTLKHSYCRRTPGPKHSSVSMTATSKAGTVTAPYMRSWIVFAFFNGCSACCSLQRFRGGVTLSVCESEKHPPYSSSSPCDRTEDDRLRCAFFSIMCMKTQESWKLTREREREKGAQKDFFFFDALS